MTSGRNLAIEYDLRLENLESVKQRVQELLKDNRFTAKSLDDACCLYYKQTHMPTNFVKFWRRMAHSTCDQIVDIIQT